ncbi:uroporphyrinogen-III C-methyltransferase [Corynebacterium sp. 13CS0277]|uniref:uroporphyrinogen-III C-methyltransferase n=1 Tax=Corynebacterium sp. 13CS0277 TaxID=2071994 RepID=UPI0011B1EFCF|nr:uroporphyrinogen-III C-methyltransferase [Corynebacterium sp. 13CS0277]
MDSGIISLISGIGVAIAGGFWGWLQARENRRGGEAKASSEAALRINERLEANLKQADERAADFLLEANQLRERMNAVEEEHAETQRQLTELSGKITILQRRIASADHLLQVAMRHIEDLRTDFAVQYPQAAVRPLPPELKEYRQWEK